MSMAHICNIQPSSPMTYLLPETIHNLIKRQVTSYEVSGLITATPIVYGEENKRNSYKTLHLKLQCAI